MSEAHQDRIAARLLLFWTLSPSTPVALLLDEHAEIGEPWRSLVAEAIGVSPAELHDAVVVLLRRGSIRFAEAALADGVEPVPFIAIAQVGDPPNDQQPQPRRRGDNRNNGELE